MSLVVDASVVAKWVFDEDGSERANAVREQNDLMAPSLIASEVANALWKAEQRGAVERVDAIAAMRSVLVPLDRIIPDGELQNRALELAMNLKHPVYDCFYLALAERERAPLITADKRLIAAARKIKGIDVRPL